MTTRIIVAGILSGIAMFIWTSIAHMCIPALGEAGIHEMPNESDFVAGMKANFGDSHGLYIFPGSGLGQDATPAERREAMRKNMAEKLANGPSGILMYHASRPLNMPRLLGIEFATEVLEAILVVFLLSSTRLLTAGSRILFVTIAGVLVAIGTNVSYWNWYGFPKRYTVAYMIIQIVGFFLVGVVSALVLKNRDPVRASQ
jgi:hypothetical protein